MWKAVNKKVTLSIPDLFQFQHCLPHWSPPSALQAGGSQHVTAESVVISI